MALIISGARRRRVRHPEHPPRQRGPIPKLYVLPTPAAQQPAPVAQQPSPPQPVLPPQKGLWALQPEGGSGAAVALTGDVMWVGRWKERCDIWLDDGGKPSKGSRMHARLEYDAKADAWTLVDNDAMYRVRVPSGVLGEVKEGASADDYVVAFVKARCLAHAGMSEHVTLHMDSVGRVGALAYRTPSGQCAPDLAPLKQDAWSFARATANVQYARVAPGLKGMHVAPDRPDSETSTTLGPDGQPVAKKPKTFFQRNWMFIMPAMFIIMNIINPPPQQQQGGGQRKAAAGGAAKKSS